MSEIRKIRFIREEPVFAQSFRQFYLKILPQEIHEWAWDWVEDVGRVMRSREMMVSFVASGLYYVALVALLSIFPGFERTIAGRFVRMFVGGGRV